MVDRANGIDDFILIQGKSLEGVLQLDSMRHEKSDSFHGVGIIITGDLSKTIDIINSVGL